MKNKVFASLLLIALALLTLFTLTACDEEPAHTHSYTEQTVAPTCTEQGYTKYTCTCGDTYDSSEKTAACHTIL